MGGVLFSCLKYIYQVYVLFFSTIDIIKIKKHSSCEIEHFVETHLCKLCVVLRSRIF